MGASAGFTGLQHYAHSSTLSTSCLSAAATNSETDPVVKQMIQRSQYWTVVSWLTYPVVYIFPMIGFGGSHAVVAIQVGYCISDIISKCGVGLVIYGVTAAKSEGAKEGALLPQ